MSVRLFIKVGLVLTAIVVSLQADPGEALNWRIEGLVSATPVTGGQNLSLSFDNSGKPHLGYLGNKYALFDETSWHFEKVVGELPYSGNSDYGCMDIDPNGNVHIVYRLKDGGSIIYARSDESQWSFIDGAGDGYPVALALDGLNHPHLAVTRASSSMYKWYDGTAWHSEYLETSTTSIGWTSQDLKLDSSGHPHVLAVATIQEAYPKLSSKILYARHDGSAWIKEYITFPNSVVYCGGLALKGSNEPHLVIYETGIGFKHLYKVGTAWQSNAIDGTVSSSNSFNIAVKRDSANRIHAAYNKSSLIRYGVYDGSWQVETVDDIQYAGEQVALNIDGKGRVHISYLENSSSGLKYARSVSSLYPEASFVASPADGQSPLTVQFTNNTTGTVSSWLWDFGDGTTSTEHSPGHTYTQPGHYTVTLSADGEYGSNSFSLPNAVWVYRLHQGENYMVTVGEHDEETSPARNRISIVKKGENTVAGNIRLPDTPFGLTSTHLGEDTFVSLFHNGEVHKFQKLYQIPKVYPTTFLQFLGMGGANGSVTSATDQYCYVAGSTYPGRIYRINNYQNTATSIVLSGNLWFFGGVRAVALTLDGTELFAAADSYHHAGSAGICGYIPFVRNPNTENFSVEPVMISRCTTSLGAIAVAPNSRDVYVGSGSSLDNKYYVVKVPLAPLSRYFFAESAYEGQTVFDLEVASLRAKNIFSIPIQAESHKLAVSPDGRWVYVTMRSGSVAIIDTTTNTVVKNVSVGSDLRGIDFSPDGELAFIGCYYKLAVINVATKNVIKNIPIEHWAFAVDVTPIPAVCLGDLDEDGDVDGSDLAMLIESGNLSLEIFAQGFGRTNCP